MSSLSASLLTEEFPALGPTSRPSSPWSTLSSIFQQRGRPYHNRTRTLSANGSSWSSRIPVLAGLSNRQASYRFYSDIGANDDEIIQEEDIRRRFADPPPTLKELHADGHKMAQGLEDEGTSGIEDDQPFFEQYITEAKECDQELITELNGSLDVLLIFAGLFSAVLAALIIESYKLLQPDLQEESLRTLQAIVQVLGDRGSSSIPAFVPNSSFSPSSSSVRVNTLWFTSLALTLGVAVQVMLAKQWLHSYSKGLSRNPRLRTTLRQYRFDSLKTWHLPEIVNMLPTMLHTSLAIFLLGLIDFLWQVNHFVAAMTFFVCFLFAALYISTMTLPHFYTDCPYKTPFSNLLGLLFFQIRRILHDLRRDTPEPQRIPLEQAEYQAIRASKDALFAKALLWLMTYSRNPETLVTVTRSLATLAPDFAGMYILRQSGAIQRVAEQFLSCFTENRPSPNNLERNSEFQLIEDRTHDAGTYAKAFVNLTEGLPASRWPQRPPRDLHLYADVLDSALAELSDKTDNAETVAFAISAREHIFRAGRNRYPNTTQQPTHSLEDLLNLTNKIADDELLPGISGVVCIVDTIRRCVEAIELHQRYNIWVEFAPALLKILTDTPPQCRVRHALSKCVACFAGLDYNRDYSEGHDPTEHRFLVAFSSLLVVATKANNGFQPESDELSTKLAENIARSLQDIVEEYGSSFVHFIRPLSNVSALLLPVLLSTKSDTIKTCIITVIQRADFHDLPRNTFQELLVLLKDDKQTSIHPVVLSALEKHMHRLEVRSLLLDSSALKNLFVMLLSTDEEISGRTSVVLLDLAAFYLRAAGTRRMAIDLLVKAGLLPALKEYFWRLSARATSSQGAQIPRTGDDKWVQFLLLIADQKPLEVHESGVMDACIVFFEQFRDQTGPAECARNLKNWWNLMNEWIQSGLSGIKPQPNGKFFWTRDV